MSRRLCFLLALAPCGAAAHDASTLEFKAAKIPAISPTLLDSLADPAAPVPWTPDFHPVRGGSEVHQAIISGYRYDPLARETSEAILPTGADPIVMLKPFRVFGRRDREAAEAIDERAWADDAARFHAWTGGRLGYITLGPFKIEAGIWKYRPLIPTPFMHTSPPVIELFHIGL